MSSKSAGGELSVKQTHQQRGRRREEGRAGAPRWTMGKKYQMMLVSPSLMQCVSPGANTPWSCISRSGRWWGDKDLWSIAAAGSAGQTNSWRLFDLGGAKGEAGRNQELARREFTYARSAGLNQRLIIYTLRFYALIQCVG